MPCTFCGVATWCLCLVNGDLRRSYSSQRRGLPFTRWLLTLTLRASVRPFVNSCLRSSLSLSVGAFVCLSVSRGLPLQENSGGCSEEEYIKASFFSFFFFFPHFSKFVSLHSLRPMDKGNNQTLVTIMVVISTPFTTIISPHKFHGIFVTVHISSLEKN